MVEGWYDILGCVQIHRNFKEQNSKNQIAAQKTKKLKLGGTHGRATQNAQQCVRNHGPW